MSRTIGLHWGFDGSPVLFNALLLDSWTAFVVASCTSAALCWLERLLSAAVKDVKRMPAQWNPRMKLAVRGLLHFLVLIFRMLCILILFTYHIGLMLTLALSFVTAQMSIEHFQDSYSAGSPEFSYQCLAQRELRELPQMTSHGPLPLLPLHRSSGPTTSGSLESSESSLLAQLAVPEEGPSEADQVHTPFSATRTRVNAVAPPSQQIRKGRPPSLVFLPHESNFTRLDITLGRFNPYQSDPVDEAAISSSPHQVYRAGSGHGKQIARKMFSKSSHD